MADILQNEIKDDELLQDGEQQIKSSETYIPSSGSLASSGVRGVKYDYVDLPIASGALYNFIQPMPCVVFDTLHQCMKNGGTGTDNRFGTATGIEKRALKFTPRADIVSNIVIVNLRKVGTLADTITIEIQSDSSNSPSGTAITNGAATALVDGDISTTQFLDIALSFTGTFTLSKNVSYWLVFQRSGALSDVNYVKTAVKGVSYTPVHFAGKSYQTGVWGGVGDSVPYMEIIPTKGNSLAVYGCNSANDWVTSQFSGFITNGGRPGDITRLIYRGDVASFNNLVPGRLYYTTTTEGAIMTPTTDTTGGTPVGIAKTESIITVPDMKIGQADNETIGSSYGFEWGVDYKTRYPLMVSVYISGSTAGATAQILSGPTDQTPYLMQASGVVTAGEAVSVNAIIPAGMYWTINLTGTITVIRINVQAMISAY